MKGVLQICICRKQTATEVPGSMRGFKCRVCGAALIATDANAPKLIDGTMTPFCQKCALEIIHHVHSLQKANRPELQVGGVTPTVMRDLAADAEVCALWLEGPLAFCMHCHTKITSREQAQTHECKGAGVMKICVCPLDRPEIHADTVGGFKCVDCGGDLRASKETAPRIIIGEFTPVCVHCALQRVRAEG